MKSNKKKRRQARKRKQSRKSEAYQAETDQYRRFQKAGPYMKQILRSRGADFGFCEYIDSYEVEFKKTAELAVQQHPSLLGVHEIDEDTYHREHPDWNELGYGHLDYHTFSVEGFDDYGRNADSSNICGSMSMFFDADRTVRSVVLIRRRVPKGPASRDGKYAFKLMALLHELGHVEDLEAKVNIDLESDKFDLIEAEVFANLHCLRQLAERSAPNLFDQFLSGMKNGLAAGGFMRTVASEVLERVSEYDIRSWHDTFAEHPISDAERALIGPVGQQAIAQAG